MGKRSKKNKKAKVDISINEQQKNKIAAKVEEEPEEIIELGKDFYKVPMIVAAVITVVFYILVFIFVK